MVRVQVKLIGDDSDDKTALLHRLLMKHLGTSDPLPASNQGQEGSCCGHATANALDVLQGVQLSRGPPGDFFSVSADAAYGFSRMYGNQLGPSDGSTGAWSVGALKKFGSLHQVKYDGHDLTREKHTVADAMARLGVPQALHEIAARHRLGSVTNVTNWKEARGLIQSGYPIIVCSNQGFKNGGSGWITSRDDLGFARPADEWKHAMALIGYRGSDTGRQGFLCWNSWGSENRQTNKGWIRGAMWPEDQPLGSFWIDVQTVDGMLKGFKDSWAISDYEGFKKRKLDWSQVFDAGGNIKNVRQNDRRRAVGRAWRWGSELSAADLSP